MGKCKQFHEAELSRIIEMAWEDRTPFEAIELSFLINESAVINIMRSELKPRSFRLWRKRVSSRKTKHCRTPLQRRDEKPLPNAI